MNTYQQKKLADGSQRRWLVDIDALATVNPWVQDHPQLLAKDLKEMAAAFPHWTLTVGSGKNFSACANDEERIVPTNGDLQCVKCGKKFGGRPQSIIWFGHLPVLVSGAKKVEDIIRQKNASRSLTVPVVEAGKNLFILALIRVIYPNDWPHSPPYCYYTQDFFHAMGTAATFGHDKHMLDDMQMCLFSSWHQMSIRDVIQNRVIPHALAQVKIANGERPQQWFS